MSFAGAQRTTGGGTRRSESGSAGAALRDMGVGQIAVIDRLHFAARIFFDIAARQNPLAAQRGQAFLDVTLASGKTVRGSFTANCAENDLEVPE